MANITNLPTEDCNTAIVAPDVPCATHNVLVQALDTLIYRTIEELIKAQSGRVTAMKPADHVRYMSYFSKIADTVNRYGNNEGIDSHYLVNLKLTDLELLVQRTENDDINLAASYLTSAAITLRISQSSRLNDGMISHDAEDFLEAIKKAEAVIDNAFKVNNPMDMPQSSPGTDVVIPTV